MSYTHIFWLLARKIKEDDIMPWASMLTLYLLLSIFPVIIIFTALFAKFSFNRPDLLLYLTDLLPQGIYESLASITSDLAAQQDNTVIPIAAFITLWSASRGVLAIFKALNKAYGIHESRGYVKLRLLALVYTIGFIILIGLALSLVVFGKSLLGFMVNWISVPQVVTMAFSYLRYGVTVLFSLLFFVSLYNLCPSAERGFRKVLPGAVFASLGLILISSLFSLYINHISNLSYLYGGLTSFIIIILWLFIVSVVIMVGGEINALFVENTINRPK